MSTTIHDLPDEILLQTFLHFAPHECTSLPFVCQKWKKLALDHSYWKKYVKIFDENGWKVHADLKALGLNVDDIEPMEFDTAIRIAALFFVRLAKHGVSIEGDVGVTILTIPKNLSFDRLKDFGADPKKGNVIEFLPTDKKTWTFQPGEKGESKSYRVLITNNVLVGSRDTDIPTRSFLVKKIGCQVPRVLEVATLAIATFVSSTEQSPKALFGSTLLHCVEENVEKPILFGACVPDDFSFEKIQEGSSPLIGIATVQRIEQSVLQKVGSIVCDLLNKAVKAATS